MWNIGWKQQVYTLGQKFSDVFLRVSNIQINLFGLQQNLAYCNDISFMQFIYIF